MMIGIVCGWRTSPCTSSAWYFVVHEDVHHALSQSEQVGGEDDIEPAGLAGIHRNRQGNSVGHRNVVKPQAV